MKFIFILYRVFWLQLRNLSVCAFWWTHTGIGLKTVGYTLLHVFGLLLPHAFNGLSDFESSETKKRQTFWFPCSGTKPTNIFALSWKKRESLGKCKVYLSMKSQSKSGNSKHTWIIIYLADQEVFVNQYGLGCMLLKITILCCLPPSQK